ncbi:hypothetical protein HYALB_00002142 [Hymenoscyphus albidus]|uniref:Uncharacterized protein n=1 Tax=Hymenoscyphus albidus TaxID=595503 RepID=A0A9N9LSA0_9HELO|nr:hypothetical protein HYALB_00002142 [Hymenoscyphus albidus]
MLQPEPTTFLVIDEQAALELLVRHPLSTNLSHEECDAVEKGEEFSGIVLKIVHGLHCIQIRRDSIQEPDKAWLNVQKGRDSIQDLDKA